MPLAVGDLFPENVQFRHVPIDLSNLELLNPLACERPSDLKLDDVIESLSKSENPNLVIVAAPGAFTPTCTENHIPPFLSNLTKLKTDKKIGAVVIITANDAFVVNAWGKLLLANAKLDASQVGSYPKVYFASDANVEFSEKYSVTKDSGRRAGRYAIAIDTITRKVTYVGHESESGVHVSGVDNILGAKL